MIEYIGLWLLIALAFNMWAWLAVMRSGAASSSYATPIFASVFW